jgi:hypothetical protein
LMASVVTVYSCFGLFFAFFSCSCLFFSTTLLVLMFDCAGLYYSRGYVMRAP